MCRVVSIASADLGIFNVRTPFSKLADALSASVPAGRVMRRSKRP
jgi:hypothetical protein